jgi:hypothetical protein
MGIANREFDVSEQQRVFPDLTIQNTVTGNTYQLMIVPFQGQLMTANVSAMGVSGSPNHSLWIQRFIAGSGITSISIGASLVSTAYGTSGAQTFTISGGVTYPLQAGDVLGLACAASNAACQQVTVGVVIKALQDFKTSFGV